MCCDFDVNFCLFLSARGVTYLFDIQVKTFNSVYDGKDLIGQARTGTGKTFSFAIPLVEKLQSETDDRKRGRCPKVWPSYAAFSDRCDKHDQLCALWAHAVNVRCKCHEIYSAAQKCTHENAAVLCCFFVFFSPQNA